VVQAGSLLLNVVPRGEPVQAEVLLSNEDVGFVALGQAAQIKVAAYPFQKYGLLPGKVIHISADASDPRQAQQTQQPQLSYRALVSLDSQNLQSPNGDKLNLSPGMLVAAEIHQGQRTVLEYLLSPVQKVGAEAARER
jgi:hemolysin D